MIIFMLKTKSKIQKKIKQQHTEINRIQQVIMYDRGPVK